MEQEVLKMLSSGKSLDRHKRVLHLLNSEDSGEYEEKNSPKGSDSLAGAAFSKTNLCLL